jgi:queuine tRNA-ribosyltransferase
MNFDGYALGGVAVGLEKTKLAEVIGYSLNHLPPDKPRYMLGVGYPEQIVQAVAAGVDLFDCVIPTRNARHASLFTRNGRINIRQKKFSLDQSPLDDQCPCFTCQHYSRAYLHHLFSVREPLGQRLATIHNLTFYADMMRIIRESITQGNFLDRAKIISRY